MLCSAEPNHQDPPTHRNAECDSRTSDDVNVRQDFQTILEQSSVYVTGPESI